ncbi:3-demethylubiquinone-9 3-methyltransferase [Thalassoglobus neptunius]|uniref:3-demethylubiquinone-9 3-methyltransferase n=1 Tax=Thalassoglobus neptunius TaxID=1938619 RepID=A0A5C5VPD2_9PLAN|nr:VOC family protein [Thalassoglobus neptunius]TWT39873.1 3-demethylubiquinone-9 3-methyltransferase [Thalassoglobus neptunius]
MKPTKNTICLWYERDAVEAAKFYAETFPDSSVGATHRAPSDNPSTEEGQVRGSVGKGAFLFAKFCEHGGSKERIQPGRSEQWCVISRRIRNGS